MRSVMIAAHVLEALRDGGEAYGLEISGRAGLSAEGITSGVLYAVLWGLEEDGLIVSRKVYPDDPKPRGGRPRTYYRLADEGPMDSAEEDELLDYMEGTETL